jgi:hypothetical protein
MGLLNITWLNLALYDLLALHPCKHILVSYIMILCIIQFKTKLLASPQITCVNKLHLIIRGILAFVHDN